MVNLKIKNHVLITWMIYFELQDKIRNRVSPEPWTGHPVETPPVIPGILLDYRKPSDTIRLEILFNVLR